MSIALLGLLPPALAQPTAVPRGERPGERLQLSAAGMFELADAALSQGDTHTAEAALAALSADPDVEVRIEAAFRLAMLQAQVGRYGEAAQRLRSILDARPAAARARLELARVLELMGEELAARRALREAQAAGLPPEVARFVDQYAATLRSRSPVGASFELAIAPDSNINRATRSDTLGTVFGDFSLDEDAQQKSGIGAALRGQAFARTRLGERTRLLARLHGAADLYRRHEFDDVSLGIGMGPEIHFGEKAIAAEVGTTWRRVGGAAYSGTSSLSLDYLQPLGRTAQLRATASFGRIDDRRNAFQDGDSTSLSLGYERALSAGAGASLSLSADRQHLRDPAMSTTRGQVTVIGYRDLGRMTLVGSVGYGRLAADERLFIYPKRRSDTVVVTSLGATFRRFTVGRFAPLVRVTWERNHSSIEVFEYQRLRTEFGIARAF